MAIVRAVVSHRRRSFYLVHEAADRGALAYGITPIHLPDDHSAESSSRSLGQLFLGQRLSASRFRYVWITWWMFLGAMRGPAWSAVVHANCWSGDDSHGLYHPSFVLQGVIYALSMPSLARVNFAAGEVP
jgi:hypothetical protein